MKINTEITSTQKTPTGVKLKQYLRKKHIFEQLYYKGSLSSSDIGKTTHISTPTITKLLQDLIDDGYVKRLGPGKSHGGRCPHLYGLIPNAAYILGIVLGRYHTRIAVLNLNNEIVVEKSYCSVISGDDLVTLKSVHQITMTMLDDANISTSKILGIGFGLPGLVNAETGYSYTTYNFGNKSVKSILESIFGLPIYIENDARIIALGESIFGLAKSIDNVLCLNIGWGIGLGMILNGKIYRGISGFSGEFGHIRVEENGKLCHCGKRGCLETIASGTVLAEWARAGIEAGTETKLIKIAQGNVENIDSSTVISAALDGDQYSINLLSKLGENIGIGLATLIHLMNPSLVVIGGHLAQAGKYIHGPIVMSLNAHTMEHINEKTEVVISEIKEDAGVLGAAALVMENIFEQNTLQTNLVL